jgi:hypothetical protein
MNGSRDRRLAKLEQAKLEQDPRFPKGVPPGARLVICSWQWPAPAPRLPPTARRS